jgi:phosphohistidine phosphatase
MRALSSTHMRQIFLMRHGEAEEHSPEGDRGRRLTVDGQRGVARSASTLVKLGWIPDRVLCSPYARAVETAETLARARGGAKLTHDDTFVPHGSARDAALRVLVEQADVLVVSHLPCLPALLEVLIDGACPFFMTPGAIVRLRLHSATRAAVAGFLSQEDLLALDARGS